MSRIQAKNTKPEIRVRSYLHELGFRFRLHSKVLPGKPDIVLKKYSTVIFVHGCFWHRHRNCKYSYSPKTNKEKWAKKFKDNIKRDEIVIKKLKNLGWKIIIIWECYTKDKKLLNTEITKLVKMKHQ